MNGHPEPPPEGALIESRRRAARLSVREAARRAGISEGWWRQVVKGYQSLSGGGYGPVRNVPADTIARMARAAGVTPEHLATGGKRPDAAQAMLELPEELPAPRRPVPRTAPPPDEEDEAVVYLPLLQQRLRDLTEAGDPFPDGEAMFEPDSDPLGAGPDIAAGLARGWDDATRNHFVDADTAVRFAARTWALMSAYRARQNARSGGQSGA